MSEESYITGHPLDQCSCSDYRRDHEGGTGPCTVCQAVNPRWIPKCQAFRLRNAAEQEDVERFKKMGIEYPEVKR